MWPLAESAPSAWTKMFTRGTGVRRREQGLWKGGIPSYRIPQNYVMFVHMIHMCVAGKKMVDWCWCCSSILLTKKSCPEWGVIPQIRPLAAATVIPSTGWSSRYCGFRWRFIRPVITSWYPLVMTNVAIENGPFIVDLPTKNVIFNSYVSLPEGRWQTSHDFGWVETPSQIGGAGFRWSIHSRNALAMGEGRSIVNRGTRQLRSL